MTTDQLRDACRVWQGDRDGGSTPLRAAARFLTGVPHYFSIGWMDEIDQRAVQDVLAQSRAEVLLDAVAASVPADATGWADRSGLVSGFAGRGLSAKSDVDDQILAALRSGSIEMPLWGLSLLEPMARSYGDHWLFVVEGPFHGVVATTHSEIKADEAEIITGGRYEVIDAPNVGAGPTIVRLREFAPLWPAKVSDRVQGAAQRAITTNSERKDVAGLDTWSIEIPFDHPDSRRGPIRYRHDDTRKNGWPAYPEETDAE